MILQELFEAEQTPAQKYIQDVYSQYQDWPYGKGDKVMVWGSGEDQQLAPFALTTDILDKNTVVIDWLQAVPQRQGVGRRAMEELQRQAQEHGVRLKLMPWNKGQVSQAALKRIYKKMGFKPTSKGADLMAWSPEQLDEISDERLQDYLSRANRQVDARMSRMARVRDRLNKGYEIYHAETPNKIVDRFEARTPAEAQRYYNNFIADYESDVDYDLRLRRATGIMEVAEGLKDDIKLSHNMSPDMLYVHAIIGDSDAGGARFKKIDGAWTGDIVHVYPQFRRQGVATKIYDYAEDLVGKIIPSKTLKSKGKKFWANRDKQGVAESVNAYHGTFQPTLDKFKSLSHFGTLQAAQDRIKAKARREKIKTPGRIYQVKLDIKNPFVAKDFAGVHSATHFAFDLKNQGLISQEEMLAITELAGEPGQVPVLIKKLRELGFDGIAYKNKYEDKGSTSYVILDPSQVVSVKPVEGRQGVAEAFDQPYPITWETGEYDSYDALAKLDDGSNLSINFNLESSGPEGIDEEWQVEFWRNNSLAVTGEGDAYKIFATVLTAIDQFIGEENPERVAFSASKDVEPGQNAQSRAKLYDRMVQRYAASWGYNVTRREAGDAVNYELTRKDLQENFADGKVKGKSRPGRVKRAGASCQGSVTDLRAKAKKYSGEKGKMYHWCANMKAGKKK